MGSKAKKPEASPPPPPAQDAKRSHFDLINSKVLRFRAIPESSPALRRVMKEVAFHHVYHTLVIAGSTLTLAEVRHIIETLCAVPGKNLQEQSKVVGVEAALRFLSTKLVSRPGPITLRDVLDIHQRVFGYVDPTEGGRLRTVQVYAGPHVPPRPQSLRRQMKKLFEWLNSDEAKRLHPVEYAARAHYKLWYVHPFVDGNGRTTRLLMNLLLMKARFPPVVIHVDQRQEYFAALQRGNQGDLLPFICFLAKCTEITLDTLLSSATGGAVGRPRSRQQALRNICKRTGLPHHARNASPAP